MSKKEINFISNIHNDVSPEVLNLLKNLYKKGLYVINPSYLPTTHKQWSIEGWINYIFKHGFFILRKADVDWKFNRIDRYENDGKISYWIPCRRQLDPFGTISSLDFEIGEVDETLTTATKDVRNVDDERRTDNTTATQTNNSYYLDTDTNILGIFNI